MKLLNSCRRSSPSLDLRFIVRSAAVTLNILSPIFLPPRSISDINRLSSSKRDYGAQSIGIALDDLRGRYTRKIYTGRFCARVLRRICARFPASEPPESPEIAALR